MYFTNTYFRVDVEFQKGSVVMMLEVDESMCHTDCFADVLPFLHAHIPDILHTKCYNPNHLSFKEEVLNTEFGHLFEHMLITLLCEETIKAGGKQAHYRASTAWDWRTNPRGTFEITINAAIDPLLFALAFQKATTMATTLCDQHIQTRAAAAFTATAQPTLLLES